MTKMKKVMAGILAVALVGITSIGIATDGFRQWGSSTEGGQVEEAYQGMVAETTMSNGMRLKMARAAEADSGVQTSVEDSVKITATLTTSGSASYDDDLTWTTAFKSESAWSSGKDYTDYVSVSVATDTHSVTVECLQPFGEPIIITATSKDNRDVTATCQLDYVKRIEEVTGWTFNAGTEHENEIRFGMDNTITAKATLGVGTIMPLITVTEMKFKESAAVTAAFSTVVSMNSSNWAGGIESKFIPVSTNGEISGTFKPTPAKLYKGSNADAPRLINNFLYKYATGNGCGLALIPEFTLQVSTVDNIYQTITSTSSSMWLEKGNLEHLITVTGVDFDKTNITF